MKGQVKKILLLEFSRIGDTLAHEPVLRELKLMYPGATIHAVTDGANYDLLAYHPAITSAEVFKRKIKTFKDVFRFLKFIKKIRQEKYDLLVNFYLMDYYTEVLDLILLNCLSYNFNKMKIS